MLTDLEKNADILIFDAKKAFYLDMKNGRV